MTANQSARNVSITIGGVDFTPCLKSFQGSDNHLDSSGLVSFTGQIVLGRALGFTESLDDRVNITRFCRGNEVIVEVANANGNLQRHPRGALRILTPKYNSETAQLTLEVGDLIALLNFKEPTDPDKAQVVIGESKPVGEIIETLLIEAGISSYGAIAINSTINYPLNLSGSYLQSIGKLLYANNRFGWIDKNETFQVRDVNFNPSSGVVVEVGKDEIWYRRLDSGEQPATIIKAVGSANTLTKRVDRNDYSEKYGIASSVDPSYAPYTIVAEANYYQEFWDEDEHILTTRSLTLKPLGLVVPEEVLEAVFSFISNKTALINYEYKEEYFFFEKDSECKLKQKIERFYRNLGNLYREVILSEPTPASYNGLVFNLVQTFQITTDYEYTTKGVISKITTITNEHVLSILNDTGEDFQDWSNFDFLTTSKYTTEEYKQVGRGTPGTWEKKTDSLQSLVRINPDIALPGPSGNKLSLFSDNTGGRETSNSGQLTPPAPERCPVSFSVEEKNISATAKFRDPCDSDMKERERTYSVEFLGEDAEVQLQELASREGKLLFGRWKGQEIATTLKNRWFDYHPLMGISAIESDGGVQKYLVDGASWVVSTMKALVSCDGIWLGNLGGATLTPVGDTVTITGGVLAFPYPEISIPGLGIAQGIQFNSYAYLLTTTTVNLQLGMGEGLQILGGFDLPLGEGMGNGEWVGEEEDLWETLNWDLANESIWNALNTQFP